MRAIRAIVRWQRAPDHVECPRSGQIGVAMKRALWFGFVACMAVTAVAAAGAQDKSQSLGEYARSIRKSKSTPPGTSKPAVFDNDNLPVTSSISVVGAAPATVDASKGDQAKDSTKPDSADAAKVGDAAKDKTTSEDKEKKDPQIKVGQSTEERQKAVDAWAEKLKGQKDKVDLLTREVDVLQREYNVKASEFYANTALRAQNPAAFAATDAKYKQQIADKQQALDAAKAKLSDMQEQARTAGAPSSVTE